MESSDCALEMIMLKFVTEVATDVGIHYCQLHYYLLSFDKLKDYIT